MPKVSLSRKVGIIREDGKFGWTTRKSAERYISRGLARQRKDGIIEFIRGDYRDASIVASAARRFHSSGDGFATLECVEGLPVAGPAIRLFTGRRPARAPRDYPGSMELTVRPLPLVSVGLPAQPKQRSKAAAESRVLPGTLPFAGSISAQSQ